MTSNTETAYTVSAIRATMAESFRRSGGKSVTVRLGRVRFTAPATIEGIDTRQLVLAGVRMWKGIEGSTTKAITAMAERFTDMVSEPGAPTKELVAIHYLLDLNTAITGDWLE